MYNVYLKNIFPWRTERDITEALTLSSKVPDIFFCDSNEACISQMIDTMSQTQIVTVVQFPLYFLLFIDGALTGINNL
jgi:hypothetical protein